MMIKYLLYKKLTKEQLQKIGSITVYIIVTGIILYNIFNFLKPFLYNKLTKSKIELKQEILSVIKNDLDSFIIIQRQFNNSIKLDIDSIKRDIIFIKNNLNKDQSAIVKLIEKSNLPTNEKINEIIELLGDNNKYLRRLYTINNFGEIKVEKQK